jgi:hypothetical protein
MLKLTSLSARKSKNSDSRRSIPPGRLARRLGSSTTKKHLCYRDHLCACADDHACRRTLFVAASKGQQVVDNTAVDAWSARPLWGSCRLGRLRAPELVKRSDARSFLAQAMFVKVEGGALGVEKLKRTSRARDSAPVAIRASRSTDS